VLVLVSFLGCGGAWSSRKAYLAPYAAILFATMAAQIVGLYAPLQRTALLTAL
jgi:hypothetical protein